MTFAAMSVSGAVMILVIALIRALALHRLPKMIFLLLWVLAALRLLVPLWIPVAVPIPEEIISPVESVLQSAYPQRQDSASFVPRDDLSEPQSFESPAPIPTIPEHTPRLTLKGLRVGISWAMGGYFLFIYILTYLRYAKAVPVRHESAARFLRRHPSLRRVEIRQYTRIPSPLTYGILRPVILVPIDMDWENPERYAENEFMLEHEWVHVKRLDVLWKLVMNLLLCLHWFNPCVWLMYVLFNRDLELACDEAVVNRFGTLIRADYARTLIRMGERLSSPSPMVSQFGANRMQERILAIMKKRNLTFTAVVLSLVLIAALLGGFLALRPEPASAEPVTADEAELLSAEELLSTPAGKDIPDPIKAREGDIVKTHVLEQDAEYVYVSSFEEETAPRKHVRMSVKDAVLQDGTIRMADIDWFTDEETLVPHLYGLDRNGLSEFGSYWNQGWSYNLADVRLAVNFEDTQGMYFYPRYVFREGKLTSAEYVYPLSGVPGFDNTEMVDWETYQKEMKVIINAFYDLGLTASMTREEALYTLEQGDPTDNIVFTIVFTGDDPNAPEIYLQYGWSLVETRDPANLNDQTLYASEENHCKIWLSFPEIEKANRDE